MRYTGDRVRPAARCPDLIVQAARSLPLPRLQSRLARYLNAVVEKLPHQVVATDALKLTAFEHRVASSIDGRRTVSQLLTDLGAAGDQRRAPSW